MSLYRRFFTRSRSHKHKPKLPIRPREPRSSNPPWRRSTSGASARRSTASATDRSRVAPKWWSLRLPKEKINRLKLHPILQPHPIDFINNPSVDLFKNRDRKQTSFCHKRKSRRQALFSLKIAGKGKRRSPGSGGTYNRTENSNYSCGA